jgi:hypothetical protein
MGTNYYLQKKVNRDGRRRDVHICKTSYGWYPHLQGYTHNSPGEYPIITSWFDWKRFLRQEIKRNDGLIFNEYDELLSFDEFLSAIEGWQKTAAASDWRNPFNFENRKELNPYGLSPEEKKEEWLDPEGYWLSSRDFS